MPRFSTFSHQWAGPLLIAVLASLAFAFILLQARPAHAAMYKCSVGGRIVYQDHACPGQSDAKPYEFKNPINTVPSQSLTGKAKEKPDNKPGWLKPVNPVEDCKAKGGTFNPEFRACMMP